MHGSKTGMPNMAGSILTSAENVMPVKFHVSINVGDLARSVDFYRKFLGQEPARLMSDYAKFELEQPPLVLSLNPARASSGGMLNHLGMRLPDSASLFKMQARLESAGVQTQREEGVQCCHSTQTKFWVSDPDQALWEIYILHEGGDEDHSHCPQPVSSGELRGAGQSKIIWRHQIPDPFPARIPNDDNSVHEAILEGTANLNPDTVRLEAALAETWRVLRPGGEISIHGLAGNRLCDGSAPKLPGPAALVQYVPAEIEPMEALVRAGFVEVHFLKLSRAPYFVINGVEMREFLLTGRKPGHRPRSATHQAIYLGPLAQVTDDLGNVFRRGERVSLNIHDWILISQGAAANQFLLLPPGSE
jgi:catechol 2,3-dioxygenase-like lactoylglutathione lyase family enzyme